MLKLKYNQQLPITLIDCQISDTLIKFNTSQNKITHIRMEITFL